MVTSYYSFNELSEIDETMCKLKRHLYKLSLLYNYIIKQTPYYISIYKVCLEKTKRFEEDLDISFILKNSKEYSYNELNDFKFNNQKYFKTVLNNLKLNNSKAGDNHD